MEHDGGKSEIPRKVAPNEGVKMHKDIRNLILINSFYNFFYGLVEPFIAIYFNQFGDISEVGISIAMLYIMQGLISLFTSQIISKIGARKIVLFAQIFEGLRIFGYIFAQNIYWVYTLQIIGGIIQGFNQPAYSNLFVDVCRDESSKSVGLHSSIVTLSYGVSALLAGFLINAFGYAPVFFMWGVQEIIYGVYIYFKVA